jgi:hypothetical protein
MSCTPQITPKKRTYTPTTLPFKPIPVGRTFTTQGVREIPETHVGVEIIVAAHGFPGRARYLFDSSLVAADNGTTILKPDWLEEFQPGRWVLEELTVGSFEPLGAVAAHEAAGNPHPQYTTDAEALTIAQGAVAVHEGLSDPHGQYQKESEKGGAGGYASLDGSAFVPDAQIPPGIARDSEVTTSISNHEAAADPHSQYERESQKNIASGYAGLDVNARVALIRGGTAADLSGTGGASQVLRQSSPGAAITVSQLAASDLSNGTTGSGAVALATSPTISTPNIDDYVDLDDQGSDPTAPSAGFKRFYAKSGGLFVRNSGGTVTGPFGAGLPSGALGDGLFHDGSNWVAQSIGADDQAFLADAAEATGVISRLIEQADLSWMGRRGHSWVEHWHSALEGGSMGWRGEHQGTGGAVTLNTGLATDTNHTGIAEFSTGTTTTGRASLHLGLQSVRLGGGALTIEIMLRLEDLSTIAQEYDVYVGLSNKATPGTDHWVYFAYDRNTSANWLIRTRDNGTETSVDSGVAVVADTWIKLRFEINAAATSVEFFIDDTSVAVGGNPITTNIPTAAGREVSPRLTIQKSAGTTARLMYVDWYGYRHKYTSAA